MANLTLPDSPEAFAEATWDDILPYYQELAARPLDQSNVEAWLRDWATLEEMVAEASAIAYNAYTTDTASAAKEAAQVRFSSEIEPQMHEQHVGLSKRLLDLGYERADTGDVAAQFPQPTGDLPRGECAARRRRGEAEHAVQQDHRRHDGRVGGRGDSPPPPAALPARPGSRRARAGVAARHRSRTSTSTTRWRTSSTSSTRCGSRWRRTPGSPTTATTSTRRRTASTTRRRTASGSTPPSSRPSCPPSRAGWSGGGSRWASTRCARGTRRSIPRAGRRSSRSMTWAR